MIQLMNVSSCMIRTWESLHNLPQFKVTHLVTVQAAWLTAKITVIWKFTESGLHHYLAGAVLISAVRRVRTLCLRRASLLRARLSCQWFRILCTVSRLLKTGIKALDLSSVIPLPTCYWALKQNIPETLYHSTTTTTNTLWSWLNASQRLEL